MSLFGRTLFRAIKRLFFKAITLFEYRFVFKIEQKQKKSVTVLEVTMARDIATGQGNDYKINVYGIVVIPPFPLKC